MDYVTSLGPAVIKRGFTCDGMWLVYAYRVHSCACDCAVCVWACKEDLVCRESPDRAFFIAQMDEKCVVALLVEKIELCGKRKFLYIFGEIWKCKNTRDARNLVYRKVYGNIWRRISIVIL